MKKNNIGKISFIVILSIGLGIYLHSVVLSHYKEINNLTYESYAANYEDYVEKKSKPPLSHFLYILIILVFSAIIFSLYEMSGKIYKWIESMVRKNLTANNHLTDEIIMQTEFNIPEALQKKIKRELEPQERIKWLEQPIPRFFSPSSKGAFLFSIPWTAFAVFWMYGASQSASNAFPLFGVPFVLIGIFMMASPLLTYFKSSKSVYAITDRRAITIEGGRSLTIRSYPPEKLQNIFRRERKNGIGDIVITFNIWSDTDGDTHKNDLGFMNIKDPKKVEKMLRSLSEKFRKLERD